MMASVHVQEQGARASGAVRAWAIAVALLMALALDPVVGRVASEFASIRNANTLYYIRYMLLHPPERRGGQERRVFLVGSSIVRDDLDEGLLSETLSDVSQPVRVDNFGTRAAFNLSALILMHQLRTLGPDLVVWGVDARTFRPSEDGLRSDARPWCRPVGTEFGAVCLYACTPGLGERYRAMSDQFLLNHWALYRYRFYVRQYLAALNQARRQGWDAVFGPYASPAQSAAPERLAAALRRQGQDAGGTAIQALAKAEDVESLIRAMQETVYAGGGRLAIVWMPGALDASENSPPALATVAQICKQLGIPLIDLRGTVPQSVFRDTVHAAADGKRLITLALAPHLRKLLDAEGGAGGGMGADTGTVRDVHGVRSGDE
jgi:hypothetical protein